MKQHLDKLAAANPAKANPTVAPTVAVTAATGGLLAGNYFCCYSWVDGFGETLTKEIAALFTVTGIAQLATITIPALPTGVQSANIYMTPPGGASGTEQLYATGVTTTTFACTPTLKADSPGSGLPTINTTGLPNPDYYGLVNSNGDLFLLETSAYISSILSGTAMSEREMRLELIRRTGILKAWYTALNEIATLAWTNQGTVGWTTPGPGIGLSKPVRTLA